jgi:hypothetical protein
MGFGTRQPGVGGNGWETCVRAPRKFDMLELWRR